MIKNGILYETSSQEKLNLNSCYINGEEEE